ncbi:MAG: peptide ABC transporter substrate-binding protein [bacterium]|nr:peptide ABC transporter substrate-binding protein [bacterium]
MFHFRRTPKSEDLNKKLVFSLAPTRIPKLRQLIMLPKILSAKEQWVMRGALAVLLLSVVGILTYGISSHLVSKPVAGGTYREALVGTPHFINPVLAITDADRDLTRLIYSGLLRYNEKGLLVGDLASEFKVEKDGTKITFVLRDNLTWHDGEPLSAQDVKFTIDAILNTTWRSPLWRSLQNVTVETSEPNSVTVTAKTITADFPHFFTFGILPKHIWEDVDPATARLAVWNIKPVGSGPFQFSSLTKSRDGALASYHLKRFQNYFDGPAFIKEVVVKFFPDFESALDAVRQHTVDGVSFVPERLRDKIPNTGLTVTRPEFPHFTGLFFQDRKSEALREVAVRRALALSLNREALAALVPDARPIVTPFLEGQIGFVNTFAVSSIQPSIDKASKILEAAGWKRDKEGWIKNKKYLSLTLTVLEDSLILRVADGIKTAWETLGVKVKLETVSKVAFERDVLRPRAYEVLLFSFVTGGDPDPYPFWHSSQNDDPGLNLGSITTRSIDAVLEKGRATLDPKIRFQNYLEFQTLLQEEVPGIVVYSSPFVYVVSKRVRGLSIDRVNTPADRLNGIAKWFVRRRPGWE